MRTIFWLSTVLLFLFPASTTLKAQKQDSTLTIVLELKNPAGQLIDNIHLPIFSFHFENNTEQFAIFQTTPNFIVKTERLRYFLTSPYNRRHVITPPTDPHRPRDDGTNFTVLNAGERTKPIRQNIQLALQQHFWDWWGDPLWMSGPYTLQIAYVPDPNGEYGNPRVVSDTLFSNPLSFTIHPTLAYEPGPPYVNKSSGGLLSGQRNGEHFQHVHYSDAILQLTGERFYFTSPDGHPEPAFEVTYDRPISPSNALHWRLVHKEIPTGHGSRYIHFWLPSLPHTDIDGNMRSWNFRESYIKRGQHLAEARLENGLLEGPFEAFLDGKHISGAYVQGKREGVWAVWRDSTVLFRAAYKADTLHGPYQMMHYNSNVPWKVGTYENGALHGVYETYHVNGRLKEHFEYTHGELSGLAMWYDEEGKEMAKGMYVDGKPYNGTFFPLRPFTPAGGRHHRGPVLPMEYKEGIMQVPVKKVEVEKEKKGKGKGG